MLRKYFLAKLFVPLIKGIVSPQFFAIFGKLNFEGISTGADLTKMVKICIILIVLKKYFLAKLFIPLITRSVSPQFYSILENWIFKGISTGADLTKMVNIWTILNCAKKIFFGKIICSTHQKKCFSTILGNFRKLNF